MKQIILIAFLCLLFPGQLIAETNDTQAVVEAHEAFSKKANKKTRNALLIALNSYSGEPTLETVNAYVAVLQADVNARQDYLTKESGLAMAEHLEPVRDVLPKQYAEARFIGAVGLFNHTQARQAQLEMAHVKGFTHSLPKTDDGLLPGGHGSLATARRPGAMPCPLTIRAILEVSSVAMK